jgi:uncharacterized membrane protein YphA (DoxX/SURF4 family)
MCGTAVAGERPLPHYVMVERRFFGVPPAGLILGLAAAGILLGCVLVGLGRWIAGAALLAVAALGVAFGAALLRRRWQSPVARRLGRATRRVRSAAGLTAGAIWLRATESREQLRLRRQARVIGRRRKRCLHALGLATFNRDAAAAGRARDELEALDRTLTDRHREAVQRVQWARERLADDLRAAEPTERLPADDAALIRRT